MFGHPLGHNFLHHGHEAQREPAGQPQAKLFAAGRVDAHQDAIMFLDVIDGELVNIHLLILWLENGTFTPIYIATYS